MKHNLSALGVSTVGTLSMNKYELAKKINEQEGLTNEEKSELLKLLRSQKKYGLVWEDKPEDAELRMVNEQPVLVEVPERAIVSDDAEAPNHILIEGDNLEALTAICYTHSGKIDVIYIDPPYNTGNKDFVYNDSFVDKEDGYRHSKWLSFMNKRLKIANCLLSGNGVIFISIDDNEQSQLKLLCDGIFGASKFVGMITRATGTTTGQDTGSLGKASDYVLIYSKSDGFQIGGIPLSDKDLSRYSLKDKKGNFSILQLRRTGGEDRREDRPTMFFPIKAPDGTDVLPYGPTGYESRWRVGPQKVEQMQKQDMLYFKKDKEGKWKVYYKFYSEGKTKRPSNLWTDIDGNKKAQIELKSILPEAKFETPKPLELLNKILQISTNRSSLILDFFAGSGTTLHATMQLNAEDGGRRQCILVTNNENGICENVTYERNRRVIQGYVTPKGEEVAGLTHNSLRYYKTQLLSRKQSLKNKRALMAASTDLLCIKNDVYKEQTLFCGRKLKTSCARYFDDGKTKMLVIYNELTVDAFAEAIYHADVDGKILIYVFSATRYAYDDNFEEVLDKVELCALPAAIYDAYKNILPKQKVEFEEPLVDEAEGTEQGEVTEKTENAAEVENSENAEESKKAENEGLLSFNFEEEGGEL